MRIGFEDMALTVTEDEGPQMHRLRQDKLDVTGPSDQDSNIGDKYMNEIWLEGKSLACLFQREVCYSWFRYPVGFTKLANACPSMLRPL